MGAIDYALENLGPEYAQALARRLGDDPAPLLYPPVDIDPEESIEGWISVLGWRDDLDPSTWIRVRANCTRALVQVFDFNDTNLTPIDKHRLMIAATLVLNGGEQFEPAAPMRKGPT